MTGRSSQNAPTRHSIPHLPRNHRAVICLLLAFGILAAACMAVGYFPDSELGRTLNDHLGQLADPNSWIP